jgi:hypothetical protein
MTAIPEGPQAHSSVAPVTEPKATEEDISKESFRKGLLRNFFGNAVAVVSAAAAGVANMYGASHEVSAAFAIASAAALAVTPFFVSKAYDEAYPTMER